MTYSYWAGIGTWADTEPDPMPLLRDLTDKTLTGSKLLMSDYLHNSVSFLPPFSGWGYNHGPDGPSCCVEWYGKHLDLGPPNISGTNQLFGDAHVNWKSVGEFDIEGMQVPGTNNVPWVQCTATIWDTY